MHSGFGDRNLCFGSWGCGSFRATPDCLGYGSFRATPDCLGGLGAGGVLKHTRVSFSQVLEYRQSHSAKSELASAPEAQDKYPAVGVPTPRLPLARTSPHHGGEGCRPEPQRLTTGLTPLSVRTQRSPGSVPKVELSAPCVLAGPEARPEPTPRVAGQTLFTLQGGC